MLLKKDKMVIGLLSLCMSPSYSYGQDMVGIEVDTYTIEEIYQSDGIVNSSNIYASKESSNKKNYTNKRHSLSNPNSWEEEYTNWKNKLTEETGFSYSFDMSVLGQRGAPNGKGTSIQFQAYPSISWELFDNEYGTGTINGTCSGPSSDGTRAGSLLLGRKKIWGSGNGLLGTSFCGCFAMNAARSVLLSSLRFSLCSFWYCLLSCVADLFLKYIRNDDHLVPSF